MGCLPGPTRRLVENFGYKGDLGVHRPVGSGKTSSGASTSTTTTITTVITAITTTITTTTTTTTITILITTATTANDNFIEFHPPPIGDIAIGFVNETIDDLIDDLIDDPLRNNHAHHHI
uniref:Uncharacterized protein n=1 Tax=Vespula pensylvanica TaxID=30213 RepID=A0A834JNV4_VESPE|nr:hypothetical protein H0235_017307 [Vespula pensylvanica]